MIGADLPALALADQFYFLAYDANGTHRLHPDGITFGLGAALLYELVLSDWAYVDYDADPFGRTGIVSAIDRRPPKPSDLNRRDQPTPALPPLWSDLITEPCRRSLRTMLDFAAQRAEDLVVARLVTKGVLIKERKRYMAKTTVIGNSPSSRLYAILSEMLPINRLEDAALLTIASAVGLGDYLTDTLGPNARSWLDWFRTTEVPKQRPDLAELGSLIELAIGSSVVTRH